LNKPAMVTFYNFVIGKRRRKRRTFKEESDEKIIRRFVKKKNLKIVSYNSSTRSLTIKIPHF